MFYYTPANRAAKEPILQSRCRTILRIVTTWQKIWLTASRFTVAEFSMFDVAEFAKNFGSGIRQEFRFFQRNQPLPKVLATSATLKLAAFRVNPTSGGDQREVSKFLANSAT